MIIVPSAVVGIAIAVAIGCAGMWIGFLKYPEQPNPFIIGYITGLVAALIECIFFSL